jgi:hypothetical protein
LSVGSHPARRPSSRIASHQQCNRFGQQSTTETPLHTAILRLRIANAKRA